MLEVLACLRRADDWDVIGFAADLVVRVKLPLDTVRAEQEAELAENADFLAKSAIRQIEARNKRQLTAKTAESLRQLTGITRSWLRDIMVQAAGASDQVVNADVRRLHRGGRGAYRRRACRRCYRGRAPLRRRHLL